VSRHFDDLDFDRPNPGLDCAAVHGRARTTGPRPVGNLRSFHWATKAPASVIST
jgi:hypothetical protein